MSKLRGTLLELLSSGKGLKLCLHCPDNQEDLISHCANSWFDTLIFPLSFAFLRFNPVHNFFWPMCTNQWQQNLFFLLSLFSIKFTHMHSACVKDLRRSSLWFWCTEQEMLSDANLFLTLCYDRLGDAVSQFVMTWDMTCQNIATPRLTHGLVLRGGGVATHPHPQGLSENKSSVGTFFSFLAEHSCGLKYIYFQNASLNLSSGEHVSTK